MNPDFFAQHQYQDYVVFRELARSERNPEFKRIMEQLSSQELQDWQFWRARAQKKDFHVSRWTVAWYQIMRRVLGLTFTAKFLEGNERHAIRQYEAYLKTIRDPELNAHIAEIIARERAHERLFISQIKEEKIAFMGSIVLGLNDGLIELTGVLVGFSFALPHHLLVALSGLITGVAASISMAASAYMQAHYEPGRNPYKAAIYTGAAYLIVVFLLVAPFFIFANLGWELAAMALMICLIIGATASYTAILFERPLKAQLLRMVFFSVGVAAITFVIGSGLRYFIEIPV